MLIFFQTGAVSDGEPDIERLMDRYSQPLMRLCYLYLKDEHLAQEAVQDTLYRAYCKYGSFSGKSSEKTWITAIALNICKDYMRKPSYREIPMDPSISVLAGSGQSCDTDSMELLNLVYQLPDDYREVILMRYYQDLSVGEIARVLRKRPNTVSVRLKRARELLRAELERGDRE